MKKRPLAFIVLLILLFNAIPVTALEKEERKWQDETIYYLLIDRFNNGDSKNDSQVNLQDPEAYQGGDFEGIIYKLDDLKDMGFTALLLTPIFRNSDNGYHGFWVEDYYKTEEHFGSLGTFKKLVNEAHKRDMKVLIDFQVNSVSSKHPWIKDPEKKDWFNEEKDITHENSQKEVEKSRIEGLPDLNQDNPEVKQYLIDAARWWINETNIDGYFLNKVNYVPNDFVKDFTSAVKQTKKDFYLLGNAENQEEIVEYKDAGIDGFLDQPHLKQVRNTFSKPDQSFKGIFEDSRKDNVLFQDPLLKGNYMDDVNTVRFTNDAIKNNQHPGTRWRLALTYLYTTPGIPIVYYGSEVALNGGEIPDNRKLMDFRTNKEFIDYISKIGELRQQLPSLTRGSFEVLYENQGMAIYKRVYQNEVAVIAINNSSQKQTVTINSDQLEGGKELRGLLANDLVRSNKENDYTIALDREEAEIYALAEKTGLNVPYLTVMGTVYSAFIIFGIILLKRAKRNRT